MAKKREPESLEEEMSGAGLVAGAPPEPQKGVTTLIVLFGLVLVLWWAFHGARFRPRELIQGVPNIISTVARMMPPDFSKVTDPRAYSFPEGIPLERVLLPLPSLEDERRERRRWWEHTFPQTVVGATLETIQMALAGTFLAIAVAFPIGFLAARNTAPHPLIYHLARSLLNLARTVPDLALGLILVSAVGLGAFAGTLALAIHTTTVLGKLMSESIENIDEGIVEAIRATGARYTQMLSFAVVPQVLPDLISFALYRLETNIRAAAVLGLIGAGGIGYLMNTSFRTFQYREASAIVLVLIVLVMTVDYLSARLRGMVL
jgi:phosphonate transport system permease protein